jgi:hypothetical protein
VTHLDYASSPGYRNAVSRAQWAVIQTGLITSGLALFGVYVLATRINDLHLMSMYATNWLPIGPMLVGLIAGSGYILASWWFGVRVGPRMIATIVLLQLTMFMACHYADFETRDLVYRDTGQAVGFGTFFNHTTRQLAQNDLDPTTDPSIVRGYAIRAAEAACFVAGGLLAALTLVGRPKCGLCGGLVRARTLGRVGGPRLADTLKRLEERARVRDARGFADELAAPSDPGSSHANAMELKLSRCDVCTAGTIEEAEPVIIAVAAELTAAPATTMASSPVADNVWRIEVDGEFATALFDQQPALEPAPHPHDSLV